MAEKYTPVRIVSTEDPFAGIGRKPLFYIDGVEYTIPVDVPAWFGMEAIEKTAEMGSDVVATRWLMIQVLGQEGWDALRTCKTITKPEMAAIQGVVRELVYGEQEEEGKG